MPNERIHIIKRANGWAIKKEGNTKASKIFDTKADAESNSSIYRTHGHDIIVHKSDGTIAKWKKAK